MVMTKNFSKVGLFSLAVWCAVAGAAKAAETTVLDVGFVTEAAVKDGVFRVLIPTATDSANLASADGAWNSGTAINDAFVAPADVAGIQVQCPTNVTGFEFGTAGTQIGTIYYDVVSNKELTAEEAGAANGAFVRYLGFLCPYTGTGAVGSQFATGTNSIKISGLVSPLATGGESVNEAVAVPGKIQLLENGYTAASASGQAQTYVVSDRDVMISAFTKNVLVTAKVSSSLTFKVTQVGTNEDACGAKPTVASTPTLVNYGAPLVNTFVNAAQRLQVTSAAAGGYVITAEQDSNMMNGGASDCSNDGLITPGVGGTIKRGCIPNFGWNKATQITPTTSAAWTDPTETGLGYTVVKASGADEATVATRFGTAGDYSRFSTGTATAIASNSTISGNAGDNYDVCYRLSVDAQNDAGVYDNSVTYTITASF